MGKVKQPKLPEGFHEYLGSVYSESSEVYDRLSRCQDYNKDILKYILNKIDLRNKVVLDMGAGTGKLSIPMVSKARLVYALDNSKPMLKILRRKIRAKRIRKIKILESKFEKIPLPNESVDAIVSFWCFPGHSKSWEGDLKEARRVLKKGGEIILADTHYGGEYQRIKHKVKKPEFNAMLTKYNKSMHRWIILRGFSHKVIKTLTEFGSKRNVERACGLFFGYEISTYLLARDRTSFHMNVSVFYWKKPK